MARYALVKAGKVVNVVDADAAMAATLAAKLGGTHVQSDSAGPDDDYSGGVFSRPAPVVAVPEVVSMFAFTVALNEALSITEGAVDAAISGMAAGRPKRLLSVWWKRAHKVNRKGRMVNDLQALLGVTNAQVREVFLAAEQVED